MRISDLSTFVMIVFLHFCGKIGKLVVWTRIPWDPACIADLGFCYKVYSNGKNYSETLRRTDHLGHRDVG
jgi:hypothetical protein